MVGCHLPVTERVSWEVGGTSRSKSFKGLIEVPSDVPSGLCLYRGLWRAYTHKLQETRGFETRPDLGSPSFSRGRVGRPYLGRYVSPDVGRCDPPARSRDIYSTCRGDRRRFLLSLPRSSFWIRNIVLTRPLFGTPVRRSSRH